MVGKLARSYRRLGFNLLPIEAGKKPPASWRGWIDTPQAAADMKAMDWKSATGVGALGGLVSGDLYALDFDKVTRDELLSEILEELNLPSRYEWAVRTPGGGLHVWVRCADIDAHLNGKGKLTGERAGCDHVELRGRGHQTLLPGSRHPNGGVYRFAFAESENVTVPDEPPGTVDAETLRSVAVWGRQEEAPATVPPIRNTVTAEHPYVQAAVEGEIAKVAGAREHTRNDTLNNAALALGGFSALSLADVVSALLPAALSNGLPEAESRATIRSGFSAGRKSPREIPEADAGPAISWKKKEAPPVKPARRAVLRKLSTVEPEEIRWLWPGRLAAGKLTLIAGDPGLGKSFLSLDMAARISSGTPWPDGSVPTVGNVVLLTAEDGVADTIVPRLRAMGGDTSRIHVLESVLDAQDDHERVFRLMTDLAALADAIDQVNPALVIIDPLSAYLAGTDSHKTAEVRQALAPLMTLGDRTGVTPLCLAHLSKGESRAAIYRVSGSLDFVAAARAAFLVAQDPDDEERRLVLSLKMNIAERPAGIAFSVADGRLVWDDRPVTVDLADVLSPSRESRTKNEAAKLLLIDLLAAGPASETEIIERANREGISLKTLKRAKGTLRIVSEKRGMFGGWWWSLPEDSTHSKGAKMTHFEGGQDGPLRLDNEGGQDDPLRRGPNPLPQLLTPFFSLPMGSIEGGQVCGVGDDPLLNFPSCQYEGHDTFWRQGKGDWRCGTCRPPAVPEAATWYETPSSERGDA